MRSTRDLIKSCIRNQRSGWSLYMNNPDVLQSLCTNTKPSATLSKYNCKYNPKESRIRNFMECKFIPQTTHTGRNYARLSGLQSKPNSSVIKLDKNEWCHIYNTATQEYDPSYSGNENDVYVLGKKNKIAMRVSKESIASNKECNNIKSITMPLTHASVICDNKCIQFMNYVEKSHTMYDMFAKVLRDSKNPNDIIDIMISQLYEKIKTFHKETNRSHGDLHLKNILVKFNNGSPTVWLIDPSEYKEKINLGDVAGLLKIFVESHRLDEKYTTRAIEALVNTMKAHGDLDNFINKYKETFKKRYNDHIKFADTLAENNFLKHLTREYVPSKDFTFYDIKSLLHNLK